MSNKTEIYEKDNSYKLLRKMLSDQYGIKKTTAIFEYADSELNALLNTYSHIPKGEHSHTDKYIFPRIAMFRAMEREIGNDSMPILDELIQIEGAKVGNLLRRITAIPFMEKPFLKLFALVAKKQFGEKNGFKQQFYSSLKNRVKFDIIQCPYCKYCVLCGCPELTHTFCDSDAYCFGSLSKIDFTREQTLENGEKCDFTLTINTSS